MWSPAYMASIFSFRFAARARSISFCRQQQPTAAAATLKEMLIRLAAQARSQIH
jgi:hypothetical protein